TLDLELRVPTRAPLEHHLRDHPHECPVARAGTTRVASEAVEPPHRFAVEPDPGGEAEAAAVDRTERDAPRAALRDREPDHARGRDGVTWQPERPREDAGAAARQESERKSAVGPVQRLVVGAVAGEDDDRIDAGRGALGRELRRMPRPL